MTAHPQLRTPVSDLFPVQVRIDPRIRLLLATLVTVASFALTSPAANGALVALAAALLIIVGRWRAAIATSVLAAAAILSAAGIPAIQNRTIMLTLAMLVYLIQKLVVMSMMGMFLTTRVSIALAVSTLETLRAPTAITIPFAVALRLIPTIRQDWYALIDCLRIRGLAPTPRSVLTHPLRTAEHLIIPILMRALRSCDDLASAGLARGLDITGPRTILHKLTFRPTDIALVVAVVITVATIAVHPLI